MSTNNELLQKKEETKSMIHRRKTKFTHDAFEELAINKVTVKRQA